MIRRLGIICFLTGFIVRGVFGGMAAEDSENVTLAETLSPYVVLIENTANAKYCTGTLFSSSGTIVLTNYHILDSSGDAVNAYLSDAGGKAARYPCRFIKGDAQKDMAVFAVECSSGLLQKGFSLDVCAGDREITRGIRIVFLGFPLYYGMTFNSVTHRTLEYPVFRTGTIASEIDHQEFLIDAMVSNGNSGSPVFIHIVEGKGHLSYRLVGIIKQYQHDTILFKDGAGAWNRVPHNTGLGVVIPAEEVKRFLGQDAGR